MNISSKFLLSMLGAIGASILLGLLVGHLSVPTSDVGKSAQIRMGVDDDEDLAPRQHNTQFMASIAPGSHLPSILLEIQYAYEVGITEIILQSPIPWTPEQQSRLAEAIEGVRVWAATLQSLLHSIAILPNHGCAIIPMRPRRQKLTVSSIPALVR